MKFELIYRNEYGERSIINRGNDLDATVKLGHAKVTEDNISNALALDEKMNDWENYMVEILDENGQPTNEAVFGGELRGSPFVYHFKGSKVEKVSLDKATVPMRFYIGTDNGKDLYASVASTKSVGKFDRIEDIKHRGLEGKGVYYVNVIE